MHIICKTLSSNLFARIITSIICLAVVWFSISYLLCKSGATSSNDTSIIVYFVVLIGFITDSCLFNYYDKGKEIKYPIQRCWTTWYVRYSFALLYFCIAVALYSSWSSSSVSGLAIILVNPVIAGLFGIMAVARSYEISLVLTLTSIGYLLLTGIASLPTSIAIIIGAVIIAWAVRTKR